MLLLLTGPAGAGKTTVATAWCRRRAKAAMIQLDEVRGLIVSGYVDPQGEPTAVHREQYEIAARGCIALAREFVAAGYDVATDVCCPPSVFDEIWRPALAGLDWRLVVLRPSLDETLRRGRERDKRVREDIVVSQHASEGGWATELQLDSSGLSVDETVDRVEAMIASQVSAASSG